MKNLFIELINKATVDRLERKKKEQLVKRLIKGFAINRKKPTEQERLLVGDVVYMLEDMVDYLLLCTISTKEQYLQDIKAFLDLEHKTYNYLTPLDYKVGEMSKVVQLILCRHEVLELERKIMKDIKRNYG